MLLSGQPDLQVVGATADGCAAIALAIEQRPDLAILDLGMPGCNGIEAAQAIRTQCPATRVLALTMHADGCFVRRMVDAGAGGYVLKTAGAQALIAAVRAVGGGGRWFSPGLGIEGPRCRPQESLSKREREVLTRLAEGQPMAEIAAALGVSVKTVETYRRRLMAKLSIGHVPGLVVYALRHGYLRLDALAGVD
ncbi:response regulator [Candidatus Thiodictyon syntrophicum]|jgi:DNA-binding NarL/FixJ family response regulator|uniref:DNA-binding response regulator n=1 Tax=Candidatus Thiodictyon syntrophicum TaxID=1166950 RepID=A0A2K8UDT5_9GAMM|nr:hypothetical protein THSYN_24120 [Candidatus Thiodictyon syntrophicum]